MLKLKNIYKQYPQGKTHVEVLKGINFSLKEGDFVSIMGPSGSGKTTLINILGLLDMDFRGEYYLNDESLINLSEEEQATYRNQYIGFVFQNFNLIDEYTVKENILLPFLYSRQDEDENHIQNLIRKLGLEEKVNEFPSNLSGGQKQRVALIRALAHKPKFLIADEPTGALDEQNRTEILKLLKDLNEHGVTIVLITHDKEVASYSQIKYDMRDGHLTLRKENR